MPDLIKPVKTIKDQAENEYKEKGSVFLAIVFPVSSKEEAEEILHLIRKKYYDATHHCYAYRLKDNSFRFSDDGEPSGTAGIRILNAIDHFEMMDMICVVVRWFGGTKLGVGPLGKAYYISAELVIRSAAKIELLPHFLYKITVPYELTNSMYYVFSKYSVKLKEKDFSGIPEYKCLIPAENNDIVISELGSISNNKISCFKLDMQYIPGI